MICEEGETASHGWEGQNHRQACRAQPRTEGAGAETLALTLLASSPRPSPEQVSLGG